jgi:hypothetical protein
LEYHTGTIIWELIFVAATEADRGTVHIQSLDWQNHAWTGLVRFDVLYVEIGLYEGGEQKSTRRRTVEQLRFANAAAINAIFHDQ